MNVREALEKVGDEKFLMLNAKVLAPIIERALRAAWNKGLADSHHFPVNSDNGVTAGVKAMVEK